MKCVVILPTYNEKHNLQLLLPKLFKIFKKIKHDMHLLVVDDKSPDGTAEVVKKFQKRRKYVHLIQGEKEGLGVAYLRGFEYAVEELKADVMFEMDADLSHPPELLPKFIEKIEDGYDIVIGSRYIPGGDTPDWGPKRKLISRGGNFFARIVSGMYEATDCTSGYRALRASIYKKIEKDDLKTRGYAFQSSLLFEYLKHGAKLAEIPLVFPDRQHGRSKLKTIDIIEFFFNAFRLRMKTSEKIMKFGLVGATGTAINMGLLWLITEFTALPYTVGSPIAVEASILWNFFFNTLWTFKETTNTSSAYSKLGKFHMAAIGGFIVNYIILVTLTEFFGIYYLISNLIGICFGFLVNYAVNVKWTWREDG